MNIHHAVLQPREGAHESQHHDAERGQRGGHTSAIDYGYPHGPSMPRPEAIKCRSV